MKMPLKGNVNYHNHHITFYNREYATVCKLSRVHTLKLRVLVAMFVTLICCTKAKSVSTVKGGNLPIYQIGTLQCSSQSGIVNINVK